MKKPNFQINYQDNHNIFEVLHNRASIHADDWAKHQEGGKK